MVVNWRCRGKFAERMERKGHFLRCTLSCLLPCLLGALSTQSAPQQKPESFSIDLTHFSRPPQTPIHPRDLFFRPRDWRSKKRAVGVAAARRGGQLTKGDNTAGESFSALAMKLLNLSSTHWKSGGNDAVMAAEVSNNRELFSLKRSEHGETKMEGLLAGKRTPTVFLSHAPVSTKEFIDRKESGKGAGREGNQRGHVHIPPWLPPLNSHRSGNTSFTPSQANSQLALRPRAFPEDSNTERKSTVFRRRRVGSFPLSLPNKQSILSWLEFQRESNALSPVHHRGFKRDAQNKPPQRNQKLRRNIEREFPVVRDSGLCKSTGSGADRTKSDSSTTGMPSASNSRWSELLSAFSSRLEPSSPLSWKRAKPQNNRMIFGGESITGAIGVHEVPWVISRRLYSERGQGKRAGAHPFPLPFGHPPTPAPLLVVPTKNRTLTERDEFFDLKVEGGGGIGQGRRGRVRRDVQNDSDVNGSTVNTTSGAVVNRAVDSNANNDLHDITSTETVSVMSSLSSVTDAVSRVSSSQTVVTMSHVSSTSDVDFVDSASTSTTTMATGNLGVQQSSSTSSSTPSSSLPPSSSTPSSSLPPSSSTPSSSTVTSQKTTKAAEISSSSRVSSVDVESSTTSLRSVSSSPSVTNASQTRDQSPIISPSSIHVSTTTKAPATSTISDLTPTASVTSKVTSGRNSNEAQTVPAEKSRTPLLSKFESSSTLAENAVSPTATSHRRTPRSTQSSSGSPSSSSSVPAAASDAEVATSTSSIPSGSVSRSSTRADSQPMTSADFLTAESPQNLTTPSAAASSTSPSTPKTDPPGSQITSEDGFGDLLTSHPEPQPEVEPYPEPGQGSQEGGGGEKGKEGEEEEPTSEPGPDWINAKMVWQGAWEAHLYTFACLFAGLGLYTLVCVLRLWRIHRLLSRRYFVSLNLLMLLLALSRAVYLSVDGYNSRGTFHPSVDYFFYSISFPCLTSAFSIQLYALLQATKMQFLPPTIQKMSLLVTMIVFHFVISLVTDVIVGMYAGMEIMLFVCQLFFILWGLFLFFGYAYIFRRLYLHAVKRQKNVLVVQHHQQQQQQQSNGSSGHNISSASSGSVKPKSKFTLSVAVKVTFSTAILGLLTVGLEIYGVFGVYKNFSAERPEPWPWYVYHTALRLVEFLMCATMSYVASQPFRYRKGRQTCCCPVLCAPCAEIFCCGADVNRSDVQAAWSELDQQQFRASMDRGPVQQVTLDQEQLSSKGAGQRGSKKGARGRGSADLTVTAKARIYFSDQDDVRPIVTSQPGSRPTSETSETLESRTVSTGGSVSGEGSVGTSTPLKKPPASFPTPVPSTSTPMKSWNGVVNTAYTPTTEDPQPQSPGFKSRKSSIASSEYYLAPSVSLADSMASELDKAFRSMHDQDPPQVSLTSLSGQSQDLLDHSDHHQQDLARPSPSPGSALHRFLHHHPAEASNVTHLRRSHSAFGRSHFYDSDHPQQRKEEEEARGRGGGGGGGMLEPGAAWHQKLFRSRSDNLGGVRTKDVAKATYMSLLDIEQRTLQQEAASSSSSSSPAPPAGHTASQGDRAQPAPPATHTDPCSNRGATASAGGKATLGRNNDERCRPPVSVSDRVGGNSGDSDKPGCHRHHSPSPVLHDVTGGMTSAAGPYCTVISVGAGSGARDRDSTGDRGSDLAPPSLSSYSSPSPFSPPPFSGSPSLFRSGLTSSPHGLMGYGSPLDDEEDDIEV